MFWLIQTVILLAAALLGHAVIDYTHYRPRLSPAQRKLEIVASIATVCAGICCAINL
ncbi:hypothetical protein [Nocardia sp. NPDC050435]|uniref:hypothetical protein n=1 Tax=Nocardia sp. NPDC050435 TaxID=3155040 RepID=UPI0033CDA447